MTTRRLRHGYTTGACAAAAAKGAAAMLRSGGIAKDVEIILPAGERVLFTLHGQEIADNGARCFVVKDAGDDPDVTNGAEIHAEVERLPGSGLLIQGGRGVGRVTKPGLAVPPGEWAINPVPRKMISESIREIFPEGESPFLLRVTVSIPAGEELAKKTLNERLGIVGGLSILGTTGIVRPISAKAWTDTIDAALDVAIACGCADIVLATGRTSEKGAQSAFSLPDEAFVMMGDHVGYAMRGCSERRVRRIVLAGQFAKLLKIACEHEQTHVSSSDLDLQRLAAWLRESAPLERLTPLAEGANTAREVLEGSGYDPELMELVCRRAREFAFSLAPGAEIRVLLAGYGGEVLHLI